MAHVLIIEDDRDISNLVRIHLTDLHHQVEQVYSGGDGLERALSGRYELVVLDLMLPDLDGVEICRRLRAARSEVPILMLTARSEEVDKVLGLETGADDYLTKPFSVRELMARIKALLRRSTAGPAQADPELRPIERGALRIDPRKREASLNGTRVELTPKEYDLLLHLMAHPGVTFTREELLRTVWGYEFSGYEHTVNSHINRLRNKVERDLREPEYILTTWGVGYRSCPA